MLTHGPGLRPLRRSRRFCQSPPSTYARHVIPVLDNANHQLRSPFFTRLPGEIRRLVYSFVAPSQVIHVNHSFPEVLLIAASSCCWKQGDVCHNLGVDPDGTRACDKLGILGLPMACRLTYAECIPVFYHQICFLFTHLHPWRLFCDNLLKFQMFTPGALQSLRSVQIDFRVLGRATFTTQDEAILCASLEMLIQQAPNLENLYVHIAPRSGNSARLQPLTLNLFRALSRVRGLRQFDFGVQHPLHRIPMQRLSFHGAGQKKLFQEKVTNLKKTLDSWVHEPRGLQTAEMDRVLHREFARIIALKRSNE